MCSFDKLCGIEPNGAKKCKASNSLVCDLSPLHTVRPYGYKQHNIGLKVAQINLLVIGKYQNNELRKYVIQWDVGICEPTIY